MSRFAGFDLAAAAALVAAREALPLSFPELVAAYHAAHVGQGLDLRLRKWCAAYAGRSAWSVERDELARAAQAMVDHGYSPATVNRDLSAIGQVYKWAVHVRKCSPAAFRSPTLDIPRFTETMRRVEATAEQVQHIRASSLAFPDRRFGLLIYLLTDTGCRRGELLPLTWDRIDSQRCEAQVDGKTGPRVVAITDETARMVERLRPGAKVRQADRVFASRTGGTFEFRKPWHKLMTSVGRSDLTPHDLRHVVAARMLRAGVGVGVAAQALGHSSLILQRRYGHLDTTTVHAAQRKGWADAGMYPVDIEGAPGTPAPAV